MINNLFFNRELSWLEFNSRVLNKALQKDIPLMERFQFLSIVTSNFDEFFQVRVASAKRAMEAQPDTEDSSSLTPAMVLKAISKRAHEIFTIQQNCLINELLPELKKSGIEYISNDSYTQAQTEFLKNFFKTEVFPLLTPLRTDTLSFPHIINLSIYSAFLLRPISGIKTSSNNFVGDNDQPRIALVKLPGGIQNIIWLPSENKKNKQFTLLQDVISSFGTQLFPGFSVEESLIFKVIRDADFAVDEDSGSNFINAMEDVLIQRKSSFPVQITVNSTSQKLLNFLAEKLNLQKDDIYKINGIINPGVFTELRDIEELEDLSFPKWTHFYPKDIDPETPMWDLLKISDKLLHVPYESYDPVVKFLNDAADDKDVLSIKMTLYRTGRDSPIISALERAAQNGKQVVVLVELKARFDEERNIAWAQELEQYGVTVIYGLVNLKVHAKILMIIRRENEILRRYVHLSTGNYNTKTAKLYSDLSLFTANPEIANDATQFFNLVTGYSTLHSMQKLGMAPLTLKSKILAMIQREIEKSTPENPGCIMAKMNSLTHEEVIQALYRANNAGVKIYLNIRGICTLVPGIKGQSENIKVISIVDRFLEHSRIFYFQNSGSPEIYCSSADWMPRNLDRRIELMFPILDKKVFNDIYSILQTYFSDNTSAEELQNDGKWVKVSENTNESINSQETLYKKYKKINSSSSNRDKIQFKVRRQND